VNYFREIAEAGIQNLKEEGLRDTAIRAGYFGYSNALKGLHQATGKTYEGTPVYEEDWDAMIVLDACRTDLMQEVSEDYDFVNTDFGTFYSLAGASDEWMDRNFSDEYSDEKADTLMVTGNGFSEEHLEAGDFLHLEEAWRYAHDPEKGAVMPGPITDSAINLSRQHDADRIIVHYMQPHYPFLDNPDVGTDIDPARWGENDNSKDPWDEILTGETTREEVWPMYRSNLETVMNEVEILLNNMDAEKTVVTADHGNALGRLNREDMGVHGHERKIAVDALREVPWIETTAEDHETYHPDDKDSVDETGSDEILKDLGYL